MSWVSTANTDPTAASICAGEYHGASKVRAETAIKVSSSLTSSRRAGRSVNAIAVGDGAPVELGRGPLTRRPQSLDATAG